MDNERISSNKATANAAVSTASSAQVGVGELARDAETHIANERFVHGFSLLILAQERASADGTPLQQDDAINLGNALATAGHAFYNNYILSDGQSSGRDTGPGSDGLGRLKFQEAAEIFEHAIESDPHDSRAYLGLSEMQWELGQDSTHTITQLEVMLEEQPARDSAKARLEIARHYQRLEDEGSAIKSYTRAVENSVDERHLRYEVARDFTEYLGTCDIIEQDVLQGVISACIRAIIQDPDDQHFRAILGSVRRLQTKPLVGAS